MQALFAQSSRENPGPYGLWDGYKAEGKARDRRGGRVQWINAECELLGHGELSIWDMIHISRSLTEGEIFGLMQLDGIGIWTPYERFKDAHTDFLRYAVLRDYLSIVIVPRRIVIRSMGFKDPLKKINRKNWARQIELAREFERQISPQITAWKDLPEDVCLAHAGSSTMVEHRELFNRLHWKSTKV